MGRAPAILCRQSLRYQELRLHRHGNIGMKLYTSTSNSLQLLIEIHDLRRRFRATDDATIATEEESETDDSIWLSIYIKLRCLIASVTGTLTTIWTSSIIWYEPPCSYSPIGFLQGARQQENWFTCETMYWVVYYRMSWFNYFNQLINLCHCLWTGKKFYEMRCNLLDTNFEPPRNSMWY